jgi:peptidoglycan/xylan/chitin deacetylase (PgdA/CDA1 family)
MTGGRNHHSVRTGLMPLAALAMTMVLASLASACSARASTDVQTSDACPRGYVGLTFDDGPSAAEPDLLTALLKEGLRATMFYKGNNASARPELVMAERDAKMWQGNHTFSHPHLPRLAAAQRLEEISSTQWVLRDITDREPTLFRPPYGDTNGAIRAEAERMGLLEVLWTVDSEDWNGASVDQIVAAAATLNDGGIILMHDWPPNTVQAIPGIAQVLRDRGLCAGRIAYTPEVVPFGKTPFHAKAVKP